AAAAARGSGSGTRAVALGDRQRPAAAPGEPELGRDAPTQQKIDLLQRVDAAARAGARAVTQVSAGYGDTRREILVANSDGLLATDAQCRTVVRVSVVANGDTGMQTGYESAGR